MLLASSSVFCVHFQASSPARARPAPLRHGAAAPRRRAAAAAQHRARRLAAAAADSNEPEINAASSEQEMVPYRSRRGAGKLVPVRSGLAAELQPLAALAGVADAAALSRWVAALGPAPEQRVIQHGAAVAQLLLSLGVQQPQLVELMKDRPLLFSWPPGERAAVLFGQLARLGLTAAEAARCFVQQPAVAGSLTFEPAIAVLTPLFAAGSKAGGSRSGEQLLGGLLRRQPAAVGLLMREASTLQERLSNLEQRYGPHWRQQNKQAVIVRALKQHSMLLALPPDTLLALEAALQQELGRQPGDGTRLLADILQYQALAAGGSEEKLRQRARALVAEFGREALLGAAPSSLAQVLGVDTAVWQRALAVWRLLGVPNPAAVASNNLKTLGLNWLDPARLAALTALQRLLPWRPSAAGAVQQCAGYVADTSPKRLIGRLLFLQQEGALPLVVADKQAARQQWRGERGLPAGKTAVGEPQFVSLRDVPKLSDAEFCALPALGGSQQDGHGGQLASSSSSSSSSASERYDAFMVQLPQLPAYQQLLAAGAAESGRLAAALPPELVPAAGGDDGGESGGVEVA